MANQTPDVAEINLRWSHRLLQGLIAAGLRLLVLSPGSRSTPLVLAAQSLPDLAIQPILDERSAAFFALGAARASGRPVALLATSGSAPAHWYPAIIEAHQSGVPLVLLSADRPPQLRHWGANQTIDQTRLFGGFVQEFHDPGLPSGDAGALKAIEALGRRAAAQACGLDPGPVQLNLPFEEPLVPADLRDQSGLLVEDINVSRDSLASTGLGNPMELEAVRKTQLANAEDSRAHFIGFAEAAAVAAGVSPGLHPLPVGRGLILCGPITWRPNPDRHDMLGDCSAEPRDDGRIDLSTSSDHSSAWYRQQDRLPLDPARSFAKALGQLSERLALPVLADPLSNLRFGPWSSGLISSYDSLLRNPELANQLRPDWVLRFGAAPVSKTLNQWLEDIPTLLVDPAGRWSDPGHDVFERIQADPLSVCHALLVSIELAPSPGDSETQSNAPRQGTDPAASRASPAGRSSAITLRTESATTETESTLALDRDWLDAWRRADAWLHRQQQAWLQADRTSNAWHEATLIQRLLARIPDGDGLLCANSLPIRQIDTWSGNRHERLRLFGNRGVSGIDGQLSTLAGLNRGGIPTWGLLGDLSFTHDLAALSLADQLQRPLIVINNGGGRIFDYLPQHGLPNFESLWRTPVAPDIGKTARLFDLPHRLVRTQSEFDEALDQLASRPPASGFQPALIEVRIDADLSRKDHLDFWRKIAEQPLEAFFAE